MPVRIMKIDSEERVVFGVVYEPDKLDSDAEFMTKADVKKAAYEFIRKGDQGVIDTQHNNVPVASYPVESFIARKGDPDYPENAWVMGVKIEDDEIWRLVKSGELNGFSVEMSVIKVANTVDIATAPMVTGVTEQAGPDQHVHHFFIKLDDSGRVIDGRTTMDGQRPHSHDITKASVTDSANQHTHRYFIPSNAQEAVAM